MTGFEPLTSGIGSDRSTTEPQPLLLLFLPYRKLKVASGN